MHANLVKRTLAISAFMLLVLAAFTMSSHAFPGIAIAQVEDPIASIRQHYAEINRSAARYKKVKKELSGFSTEGGQLIAYFHGPNLMKIGAIFYGESGKAAEEYYYWDGKLIFVLRTDYAYTKPFSGKVARTEVSRFYFNDDKLIRWIDESGKQVTSGSSEYAEKQKEYLDNSKLFTEGARSNKATIEGKQ
jgi:hypothetical protein